MSLNDYRTIWNRKPALRTIYAATHGSPNTAFRRVLEIGGGIGNLKQRLPTAMTTDVQYAPWLDCVADAHRLPFAAGTLATIVMVDVLHHLEHPATFFQEAERVLQS
jgi:SAM-dependent methyltransferase